MATTITECRFCGMSHGLRCPSIKAIEYFDDGITVKRVEFMTVADFHPTPIWPSHPINPTFGVTTTWGSDVRLPQCNSGIS